MSSSFLVLEDGSCYEGSSFGADAGFVCGEVVFNTGMTGYQEMLTDPSYAGQILVPTYPLVGNYGVSLQDSESGRVQVRGYVVREECRQPSHGLSVGGLGPWLANAGVVGISGVDTRAITRRLRSGGVMMGAIASGKLSPREAHERLMQHPDYGSTDFVREVSTQEPYEWNGSSPATAGPHIVVMDFGTKYNILRILAGLGCRVTVVPCTYGAGQVLALGPDGILLSPGPGNPEVLGYAIETVKNLMEQKPVLGICLGQQLLAIASGGRTFKLKFGHRGGNHPVKDLATGRVYITSQNHGYAVDGSSLRGGMEVSHVNLNDGTVEGMRHRDLPVMAIQYHSEASPGPQENIGIFHEFLQMVNGCA